MYDRELGCNGLLLIGNTVPIRSRCGCRRHLYLPR